MKEKTLFIIYTFLLLLIIPLGIYFLSLRQHPKQNKITFQPSPTITVAQPASPTIKIPTLVPTVPPSVAKDQFFQNLLAKLPITGTVTTTNNLSVDYTINHNEGDPNNTISIDMTNINFRVTQDGQNTCEQNLSVVSSDQQNLQYWCDYTYNKENFLFVANYIFTTYLPVGTTNADYNFLWGNREYIQQQATLWLKDLK